MSDKNTDLPILAFASQEEWEQWLEENHADSQGIWLKIAKKGAGEASVSYPEALEAALCYGWIDGQKASLDDEHWLQRFTPRRTGSKWSQVNREKADALIEQGRMKPAGLKEVESAKADGRWEAAYAGQHSICIPEDLQQALEQNQLAREFFDTLDSRNRYAILYRLQDAKKPETRAKRLEKFIAMLSAGQRIYP